MSETTTHYPALIGLWSPAMRSGKSTAAHHLCLHYGYSVVSFASPLKSMIHTLLCEAGMSFEEATGHIWGDLKETPIETLEGYSARYLMQTIGTEWGRETVYQNIWVDVALGQINRILDTGGRVVIDDMRFENEVEMVQRNAGYTINIVRPGTGVTEAHSSEGALKDHPFDFTLRNDGSIDDLHHHLGVWLSAFQARHQAV